MPIKPICPFPNEIIYYNTLSTEQELWFSKNVYGVIYKITNTLNNMIYIGRRKCNPHKISVLHNYFGSGLYIKNAIKKYGKEYFIKEYLDYAMSDEDLDKLEMYYIKKFDSMNNGYNQTIGGEHFRGEFSNNADRKKKISKRSKELWKNKSFRESRIKEKIGRRNSNVTKYLMSESAKASWTEERRKKASESGSYSHPLTTEQKEKQRDLKLGTVHVNNGEITIMIQKSELQEYLSKGWKKGNHKPVLEKTRKRMSESAKLRGSPTKGRKMIHNGDIRKYVDISDLKSFLNDGWILGPTDKDLIASKKHKSIKGRKSIIKNGIIKLVESVDLDKYLNEGWELNAKQKTETIISSVTDFNSLKSEYPFAYQCKECGKWIHVQFFNRNRIDSYSKLLCRSCIQKQKLI